MSRFAPFIPRRTRVGPEAELPELTEERIDEIADIIKDIPISVFSTLTGPNSEVTAAKGTIGIERGEGNIRVWYANKDGNSDWIPLVAGTPDEGEGDSSPPDTVTPTGHSHTKADLPSTIAYEDEQNFFTEEQHILTSTEPALHVRTTRDEASVEIAQWEATHSTISAGDEMFHSFFMQNESGTTTEIGRLTYVAVNVTEGLETGGMIFEVERDGVLEEAIAIDPDEIIVNDSGSSRSFRIEGQNDPLAFVVSGVDGSVGLGATPEATMHLKKNDPHFRFEDSNSGISLDLQLADSGFSIASALTSFFELDPTSGTTIFHRLDVGDITGGTARDSQGIHLYRSSPALEDVGIEVEQGEESASAYLALTPNTGQNRYIVFSHGSSAIGSIGGIPFADACEMRTTQAGRLMITSGGTMDFMTNATRRAFFERSSGGTFQVLSNVSVSNFLSAKTISAQVDGVPTEALDISANTIRFRGTHTPSSAVDSGNTGDISWDSRNIYVYVGDEWRRAQLRPFNEVSSGFGKGSTQTVGSGSTTTIDFTREVWDVGNIHSSSATDGVWVLPEKGTYSVNVVVEFENASVLANDERFSIHLVGGADVSSGLSFFAQNEFRKGSGSGTAFEVKTFETDGLYRSTTENEVVAVRLFQNTGSVVTVIDNADFDTHLQIALVAQSQS